MPVTDDWGESWAAGEGRHLGARKWVADKLETIRPLRRLIASGGGRGSR